MRNLSKCGILFVLFVGGLICVIAIPFCRPSCVYADQIVVEDDTVFNLSYKNKIWTFKGSDFNIDSNIFTINARINRFNKNVNRQNKVQILNKLVDIKITPEIAFNYIYLGFNNKINNIAKNIEKNQQNAKLLLNKDEINIKNEIIGIKINKNLFYDKLINLYSNNKVINMEIPVKKSIPNITSNSLRQYTYKRSEFSTNISSSNSGRKYNVRKALNAIAGTKLSKGEKFSFNNVVGRRTAERGYKNAKIIMDGEFVEGVGGGVCQVSSTLYNAVLLAGLKVAKAQKHSQPVSYVKSGFDAMVNYGTSDLVFENNTNGEVYILCKYTPDKITISIYGESLDNVSFVRESEVVNRTSATDTKVIHDTQGKYLDKVKYVDESFELKCARDGYTVKSYLIKLVDGVQVARELLRTDIYKPQQQVVVYGVQSRNNIEESVLFEQCLD